MEFKGTQGKWELEFNESYPEIKIINENEKEYASISCFFCEEINGEFVGASLKEESKANAQLVSKAPEMLEMLKQIQNAVENSNIQADVICLDDLEKLIKEATEL